MRRVKALIKFHKCPIKSKILQPNSSDSIFWLNSSESANRGDKDFQFTIVTIFNKLKFMDNIICHYLLLMPLS